MTASRYVDEAPGGGLLARLYTRSSLLALGVLALALLAGSLGLSVAVFTHAFSSHADVTLELDRAGSQLATGADVKLNGIVVGRVSQISAVADGSGATLTLALDQDRLELIPANVRAGVLPKTVFGEKYVDLRLPTVPDTARLADGDVIERDRSSSSIETSTVLNNLEPLLTAVRPEQLSATLTNIAEAVRGQGDDLGGLITDSADYAADVRPSVEQFLRDSDLLATVADDYTDVSGPLLRTLRQASVTGRTLTAKEQQLVALLEETRHLAYRTGELFDAVGDTAVKVVQVSRPILELLQKYSPELACTVRGVVLAKDRLEAVYADGPYLKARLFVSVSRGTYKPGVDSPKSLDFSHYAPYCPVTPKNGRGTVPYPPVPEELDEIRGEPQPLETVNGAPGLPVTIGPDGIHLGDGAPAVQDNSLLQLLLGGALG